MYIPIEQITAYCFFFHPIPHARVNTQNDFTFGFWVVVLFFFVFLGGGVGCNIIYYTLYRYTIKTLLNRLISLFIISNETFQHVKETFGKIIKLLKSCADRYI